MIIPIPAFVTEFIKEWTISRPSKAISSVICDDNNKECHNHVEFIYVVTFVFIMFLLFYLIESKTISDMHTTKKKKNK